MIDYVKKNKIRIKLILLDLGFCSIGVMRSIAEKHCWFLMPARKTEGIKQALAEHIGNKRKVVPKYTFRTQKDKFECMLVIVMKDNPKPDDDPIDRYIAFVTNTKLTNVKSILKRIPKTYCKRWEIETGFRVRNSIKPYTCSKNPSIRIFFYAVTLSLYNLWLIASSRRHLRMYLFLGALIHTVRKKLV